VSDKTLAESLIDDIQKICEDYAFTPPNGKGVIALAPAFAIYGVTFKKAEIIDGR